MCSVKTERDYIFLIRDKKTKHSKQFPKQKFGVARKTILYQNKKFGFAQKVIWCRQRQVVVARKIFRVNKKRWCCTKKCISCRQKQDNAAPKNILGSKKLLSFSRTARHYFVQRNPPARLDCVFFCFFFCTNNATSKSIILSCIIILYEKLKNYSIQSFK